MIKKILNNIKSILITCSLVLGAGSLVALSAAHAEEPYKKPTFFFSLSETPLWNSNPLMLRQNVQDIYGSETKGIFGFQRALITTKIKAEIAAVRNQYDQSEYNSTDLYAKASIEKTLLQRLTFGLVGNYDHDTTRSSEITTFGQDVGTARRDSFNLQPSIFYSLSPRALIGVSGGWKETRYESSTLTDYGIVTLMPTFRYNLTPLQIVTITIQGQRFSILENSNQYTDAFGPYLSWEYNFHPLWTLNLSLGALKSKSYGAGPTESEWQQNMIYGSTLRYKGLRNIVEISVLKSRQPYANGTESLLTTIDANEKYIINPTLDFTIKGSYQTAEQPPEVTGNLDSAWGGSAVLNYQIGPNWNVNTSYKYRQEKLTGRDDQAKQHIVRMGLTYQFGK